MKSTQRTMWSFVPCANAGAVRAARIPANPAPVSPTNVRRCSGTVGDFRSERSTSFMEAFLLWLRCIARCLRFVDLLELPFGPLHGVLRLHALDRLRVHVGDDVLREAL